MPLGVGLQNEATIKLKVELDSKGINGVKTLLRDLTNAMNAQAAVKQMDLLEKNLMDVKAEASKTKAELQKTQTAVVKMAQQMQKSGAAAKSALVGWRGAVQDLGDRLRKAEVAADAAFRASYRLQMVGSNLRRFSDNIVRIGTEILNTFGDFEFTMNRARGALEIWQGATLDGTDATIVLRDELVDLSKELKLFPAEEVAQGLYLWGAATGQAVDKASELKVAMNAINPIMKTAAMTNTGYEETIKGVYSVLTQYYMGSLDEAEGVTQKLFLTTQKTAAEFGDLIQSFKMVGPVAAAAGADFDEVNKTIGRLSDLGLRGSMAGRGLRQFFIQMVRPSGPATKAMETLWSGLAPDLFGGKTFMETAFPEGEFVGIEQHVKNLALATRELNAAERNRFLAQISTANMLPLLTALVAEQRRELDGLTSAEDKYANTAENARKFFEENWKLLSDSWNAVEGSVHRAVESLRITIGTTLAEVLKPFAESINQIISNFNDFLRQNPNVVAAVSKLATILAGGAGLAGVIFLASGAIIGLISAIGIAIRVFEDWWGRIGRITSAIGLFIAAIIDNFEYIEAAVGDVVENLQDAFSGAEDAVHTFSDALDMMVTPAREISGLIVRIAADIVVFTSEIVRVASNIPLATEAINALVTVIGVLISGKLVAGLLSVTRGFTLMIATLAIGRIKAIGSAIKALALSFVTLGRSASTGGLGGSIRNLGRSLTSLPFIGLAASVGFLAYDLFPPFRDIVDQVAGSFTNLRENLDKSVEGLGELGPRVQDAIIRFQGMDFDTSRWDKAIRENEAKLVGLREKASFDVTSLMGLGANEAMMEYAKALFGTDDIGAMEEQAAAANRRLQTIEGNISIYKKNRDRVINASLAEQQENVEFIARTYDIYAKTAGGVMNREIIKTRDEFNQAIIDIVSETPTITPALAGMLASSIFLFPEHLSAIDFQSRVQRLIEENPMFSDVEVGEMAAIFGEQIGELPAKINAELEAYVQKAFTIDTASELGRYLTEIIPDYQMSLAEMLVDPKYAQLVPAINMQFQRLAELEEDAASGIGLNVVEERLKGVLETLIDNTLEDITPIIGRLSGELNDLSLGVGTEEQMAQAILNAVLPSGENLLQAFREGEIALGPAGVALQEVAEELVAQGFGGDELAQLVAVEAEDASSEVGRSFVDGIIAGIEGGLTMKDVREAMKKGSTAKQLRNMMHELVEKPLRKAASGNIQARQLFRGRVNEIVTALESSIAQAQGRRNERKVETGWLRWFARNFNNIPEAARKALRPVLRELQAEYPDLFEKLFPKRVARQRGRQKEKIKEDLQDMLAITWKSVQPESTTIEDAKKVITDIVKGAVDGAVEITANQGKKIARFLIDLGFVAATKQKGETAKQAVTRLVGSFGDADTTSLAGSGGTNVGNAYINNLVSALENVQGIHDALAAIKDITIGGSPPKKGPLRNIDKGGFNVGKSWAEGFKKGTYSTARETAFGVSSILSGNTGMSIETDNKREVTVRVEVSSPDGAVDRMKRQEIRRATMDALVLSNLEHLVTVE